jgi:hypothetical protein
MTLSRDQYGNYQHETRISLDAKLFSSLTNITSDFSLENMWWVGYFAPSLIIFGDEGTDISFENLSLSSYKTIELEGDFDQVDFSNNPLISLNDQNKNEYWAREYLSLNIRSLNSFVGSSINDIVRIYDSSFDALFNNGNDTLYFYANSLTGTIDGGDGLDELQIKNSFTEL